MNEEAVSPSLNNQSVLSLVFGILTVVSFCTGMVPLPFTGFICFPTSFLFGTLALVFGAISLNQIRRKNESGSSMARTGIILGGAIFLCLMCMVVAFASLFIFAPDAVPMPPLIQNFSI